MASSYPAGIGNQEQAYEATANMRNEPWYNAMLAAWGLKNPPEGVNGGNPIDKNGNPAKLTDDQRQAVQTAAHAHGIGMNNKFDQIDENGQISEAHHKLKKLAIGAAIGGLALTGLGAAGVGPMAGLFGGATAGADVAGAAALPASGIADVALPGAMAALPEVGGAAAGAAGASGFADAALDSMLPGAEGGTAAGDFVPGMVYGQGTGGTLSDVANGVKTALKGKSTLDDIMQAAGKGVGDAATASGQNRLDQEKMGLEAAPIDLAQRRVALQDVARASMMDNPSRSPFDTTPAPGMSDAYRSTLSQLAQQGQNRLTQNPLSAVTPSNVQGATGTKKGTLETIGDYASPALTIASKIPWGSF